MTFWKFSRLTILLFVVGIITSISTFLFLENQQRKNWNAIFNETVLSELTFLEGKMEVNERALHGLVSFYNASNFVDQNEFKTYVKTILKDFDYIQALEWIPYVPDSKRKEYESLMQKNGFKGFEFLEKNAKGEMLEAKQRDAYYPVFYIVPLEGNEAAFGFDLGSSDTRLLSLEESRDRGKPVATGKIELVQELNEQAGMLIFAPVYNGKKTPESIYERRKMLKGFTVGVYRIGEMLNKILLPNLSNGISLSIYDERESEENILFSNKDNSFIFSKKTSVKISGREWVIKWYANKEFDGGRSESSIIVFSLCVFVFFTLLALIFEMISSRSKDIQINVDNRTRELKLEIEERRKAEKRAEESAQQAIEATKSKDKFLANMSHEIRTPLNGIIGFTDLLSDMRLPEEAFKKISHIRNCSESLLMILNDILDISKIEAGKLLIEKVPVDLKKAIEASMFVFDSPASVKNVILKYHIAKEIPDAIESDPLRLKQLFLNLVGNAVKFTESGTVEVEISLNKKLENSDFELLCKVKDSGIGIQNDALKKLFKSFEQADASTTRNFGGTGLGLSICARIIKLMGGRIWVESEYGIGSEFYFTIPTRGVTLTSGKEEAVRTIKVINSDEKNLKILLAEDNKVNQILALAILKKLGYENVELAVNGEEAVEKMQSKKIDLIFMDIQMPKMDGLEATKIIRKNSTDMPGLKIIGLSANVFPEDIKKGLDAGMDDYLGKPIEIEKITNILKQLEFSKKKVA